MAHMQFTELNIDDKKCLQNIAKKSIAYGLQHQQALPINLKDYSELLRVDGASFVTLDLNHQLRGCIGTLEAHQPLVKDVAEHAFAAAFQDPRFPPLTENEFEKLDIHISILTPATPMTFTSEKNLLTQLQPGIDGLILQAGFNKGTFLPSVWEQLSSPEEFLNHLKIKAGLNMNDWPDDVQIFRYETISF